VNRRALLAAVVLLAITAMLTAGMQSAGSAAGATSGSATGVSPSSGSPSGGTKVRSTRRARPMAKSADTVIARIGGERITRADIQRRLDELPDPYRANYSTPEGRQQFVDRLVEERVWLLGARKRGVDRRPELRRQLEQTERDLLIRTYVNELMSANPAPADSEAQAFYDAHVADYRTPATVTMSHILLKSESEGRRTLKSAKGREDWKKLVTRSSVDTVTRATGGALGTVTREGNFAALGPQPALAESAFALGTNGGPGAIGGPFRSSRGWHVIKVDAVKAEAVRPFDQVKSLIMRQLSQSRSQDFYKARLASEKAALGVSVDSAAMRDFVSQRKTAQQLFREGQEAGAPTARITAYRRLLQEYPESDVSPQAQFMIGFIYSEELKSYDEAEQAFQELLRRYPKSELADSARWMIAHMRSEDAPAMMSVESDSSGRATGAMGRPTDKP
jgi:peptidyl-prolyl cis-trans isomerase C